MNSKIVPMLIGISLALIFLVVAVIPGWSIFAGQVTESSVAIDPTQYRVAYLTHAEDTNQTELLSEENLQRKLGAEIVSTWSQAVELNYRERLDALIVDQSAVSGVNPDELSEIYKQGTVVAFFNVYSPVVAGLIKDECVSADSWMDGTAEPMPGDFYIIVSRLILGNPDEIELIESQLNCDEAVEITGVEDVASISIGKAADSLIDAADFDMFVKVLIAKVENIQNARDDFNRK